MDMSTDVTRVDTSGTADSNGSGAPSGRKRARTVNPVHGMLR